jgi:hypothetical protein
MIEAMQVTEPYVDGQDNMDNRVHSRKQAVDDATDIEGVGESQRKGGGGTDGEVTADPREHTTPVETGGDEKLRRDAWVGGEWAESEHTPHEDGMYKTATPSNPKITKKLKVENGKSRLQRDCEAEEGIPSPRPYDHETHLPALS